MTTKGLYAGSFDPITNGHLDIIERSAKICDELVVGVVVNPSKTPLIEIEKRKELITGVVSSMHNVKVDTFEGLLADYVNQNGFNLVIRGLRSGTDFDSEIAMAQMNDRLYGDSVDTVFLMTCPEYAFVSSSMVKEVASLGGDIRGLIPEEVYCELKEIYDL